MRTFLSPTPFFLVNFHKYEKVCRDLCSVHHAKTCYCFSKSVKQKWNFSQTFGWQEILRRKTNKSYDKTAVWNDLEYKTKKIVNLILKNAMLKAIIKVYWAFGNEFLRSDFLQCSFKVCENYYHPHASFNLCCVCLRTFSSVNQIDLVSYMSHKLRAKVMDQLNFIQRLQIANQEGYSDFDTGHTS